MKRTELTAKLNEKLGTNYNWSRLNKLDLEMVLISLSREESIIYSKKLNSLIKLKNEGK